MKGERQKMKDERKYLVAILNSLVPQGQGVCVRCPLGLNAPIATHRIKEE